MAHKQQRSAQKLNLASTSSTSTSSNRAARSNIIPASLVEKTRDPPNSVDFEPIHHQLIDQRDQPPSSISPETVERGEEAVLVFPNTMASQQRSRSSQALETAGPSHRQRDNSSQRTDSPVVGSHSGGNLSDHSSAGSSRSPIIPPRVTLDGEEFNMEHSPGNSHQEEEVGDRLTPVAMPTKEKDGSLRPGGRRNSSSLSKDESGSELEGSSHDGSSIASLNSPTSPVQPSSSCPSDLPNLGESQEGGQGFETSGSSIGSPSDRSSLMKLEREGGGGGKLPSRESKKSHKKSTPKWYNVYKSTYKSKSEEFRKNFKNIHDGEKLLADYACALQKDILVQGRMYVTENWVCFYANIFKWETLLTIRMKGITAITKERTIRLIPNALQIATDSEKYFLTSFMTRDRTFLLLFKVWQNALLDQKMPSEEYWGKVRSNYGSNLGLCDSDQTEDLGLSQDETENGEEEEEPEFEDDSKSQGTTEGMDEEDEDDDDVEVEKESELNSEDPSEMGQDNGIAIREGEPRLESMATSDQEATIALALDAEGEVQSLEKEPLRGKEYMNSYFNVTVDDFFDALYNEKNPFHRNFLHYRRKHTDIVIGPWNRDLEDRDIRNVQYTFHLNSPLAPKTCGIEENQVIFKDWSRQGHSYIIKLDVIQKGVPYADHFYSEAYMIITRVSSKKCHVRLITRLVYKKSIWGMMKGFIERSADSLQKETHEQLDEYVREHLEAPETPDVPGRSGASKIKKSNKKQRSRKQQLIGEGLEDSEQQQQQLKRTAKRMDSNTEAKTVTAAPLARYLPFWLRTDSRNVMLLICIFLTVLSIINVSLFLQLQSLEQIATATGKTWPPLYISGQFEFDKDVPRTTEEWSNLLQRQLANYEMEMGKWREVLGICIDLMKKMEETLKDLHKGLKPLSLPDLEEYLKDAEKTREN